MGIHLHDIKRTYFKLMFVNYETPDVHGRNTGITVTTPMNKESYKDDIYWMEQYAENYRVATIEDLIQEEKEFNNVYDGLLEVQEGVYQYQYQYIDNNFTGRYVKIK